MEQPVARWEEMLDEFRALGGIAENISLRSGPYGRGLFPLDPSRPVKVLIPENLLLKWQYLSFENNAFRVAPEANLGARETSFLESYERDFSWGVSRQGTEELLQLMQDAPDELRQLLDRPFGARQWLAGATSSAAQERYFASRVVQYKGNDVVMPIVELANHGNGTRYEVEQGVGISGNFAGEILACYVTSDPWEVFARWGFASESQHIALSLPLSLPNQKLQIGRCDVKLAPDRKPFFPEVSRQGEQLHLSYMMLANKNYPRIARGIFCRILREAGLQNPDETFDLLHHLNRMQFYKLLEASELAAEPLRRILSKVVRLQLEVMSHAIGTREV